MTMASGWLILFTYLALSGFGLLQLKSAVGIWNPHFIAGFASYGAGFLIWIYLLRQLPLSFVFPVAAGGLIVTTQLLGYYFLSEPLSTQHLIGVLAIVGGIVLIFT
jgi:drug/metabolite transporter (DMT)-like permease